MTTTPTLSRMAELIDRRVHELVGRRTQRDIAKMAGFDQPNMITLLKTGQTKLPIERVPAMAAALEVDDVMLFKLAVEQFVSPEMQADVQRILAKMKAA